MRYDPDQIYKCMIMALQESIGSLVSQYGPPDRVKPAIFSDRAISHDSSILRGLLPYCVVSLGPRVRQGGLVNSRWINSSGDEILQVLYDVTCTISVYGGDAMDIASRAEESFLFDSAIQALCDKGIVVKDSTGVVPSTTVLDDTPHDFASTVLMLTTASNIVQKVYEMKTVDTKLCVRHTDSTQDIVSTDLNIQLNNPEGV